MNNLIINPFAKQQLDLRGLLNTNLSEAEKEAIQKKLSDLFQQSIETAIAHGLSQASEQRHLVTLELCEDATRLNLHFPLLKQVLDNEQRLLKALSDNALFHQALNDQNITHSSQHAYQMAQLLNERLSEDN